MMPRRTARKPLDGSRTGTHSTQRVNQPTRALVMRRDNGQPTTRPPGTRREPIATSAARPPTGSSAASNRSMSAGSWLKSASMFTATANPWAAATENPSRMALPSPRRPRRTSTCRRGFSSASLSATSPVPSGEASSTTSIWAAGDAAKTAAVRGAMLSTSL